ncbi:MAG: hypothetical protein Athens041674_355 [Parcubacteria group bacterium Athens0416_74]|nr:MAG: hypothetical protein Athens041674_355 [Parcubacteria group bacterium Athens0416_74]
MNTKLVLGLLAAVVVLGGGYYYMQNSESASTGDSTEESAEQFKGGAYSGSIEELAKRGGNWKCTINVKPNKAEETILSSGVVYVSGNKSRTDSTGTMTGVGPYETHTITDGTYVYMWSSMMPTGQKWKNTMSETGSVPSTVESPAYDTNELYTYDCNPWSVDQSVFVPPSDISFTTI